MSATDQDMQEIKTLLREMPRGIATAFAQLPKGGQGLSPATLPPGSGFPQPSKMEISNTGPNLVASLFGQGARDKLYGAPAAPPLPFAQPLPVATPFSGPAMNVGAGVTPTVPNFGYLGPVPAQLPSGGSGTPWPAPASSPVIGGNRSDAFSTGGGGDAGGGIQTIVEGLKTLATKLDAVKDAIEESEGDAGSRVTGETKSEGRYLKSMWSGNEPARRQDDSLRSGPAPSPGILRPSLRSTR